jgi:hypothetical protein
VRPDGDDSSSGRSAANAWETIERVNGARLRPGDTVLFEGGATFRGSLLPPASGTRSEPITFGSFGRGRATLVNTDDVVVWLQARSHITLEDLRLTSRGERQQLLVSSGGASRDVTIRDCVLVDTGSFAINSASQSDADWTIEQNTIAHVGESGITFRGSGFLVADNSVIDTGTQPTDDAHGIYAKGPRAQIVGNTVSRFDTAGITVRYDNSLVEGNAIEDGPAGITYFGESPDGGTTILAYNRVSDVSTVGVYVDPAQLERLVIASNTVVTQDATAIGVDVRAVRALTLANNIASGARIALEAVAPLDSYSEHHNLWFPADGARFMWKGKSLTFDDYAAASGGGARDVLQDPLLGGDLAPGRGSPAIDAGSADVEGLRYSPSCDGLPYHYCGSAPDLGAIESEAKPTV